MKNALLISTICIASVAGPAYAGSISNGKWSPIGCGNNPEVPLIDKSSVDAFNNSIAAINDWQQKSRTYLECLINEANADNKLIADSANKEQEQYREKLEKISTAAKAASNAMEQK